MAAEERQEATEPDADTGGVSFRCPQCGAETTVTQVQGDRCPGCHFEFKWFGPEEAHTARDYHAVLTRQKHLLALPDGAGWVVAHE